MSEAASIQCDAEGLVWEFTVASFYWKKKTEVSIDALPETTFLQVKHMMMAQKKEI